MNNLEIYNKVREVPKEAQKSFNNGSFSGTDINPMWRIRTLTEVFGPSGLGWYTEVLEHWEESIEGEILTNVAINLYVKDTDTNEWSKPIYGVGGNKALQQFKSGKKISDEAYKMAYTDALSVACKALGIGADIYWQTDPTKYSPRAEEETKKAPKSTPKQEPKVEPEKPPKSEREMLFDEVRDAQTPEAVKAIWNRVRGKYATDTEFYNLVVSRGRELKGQ